MPALEPLPVFNRDLLIARFWPLCKALHNYADFKDWRKGVWRVKSESLQDGFLKPDWCHVLSSPNWLLYSYHLAIARHRDLRCIGTKNRVSMPHYSVLELHCSYYAHVFGIPTTSLKRTILPLCLTFAAET
jgi:hypothetical protein